MLQKYFTGSKLSRTKTFELKYSVKVLWPYKPYFILRNLTRSVINAGNIEQVEKLYLKIIPFFKETADLDISEINVKPFDSW